MIWARVGLLCLIPPAWIASASWIYCWIKGPAYPFEFPYAQWLIAAPWWQYDPWTTVSVVAGAVVPTLVLVLMAVGLIRHWWATRQRRLTPPPGGGLRPLQGGVTDNHGHSAWATPKQLSARFSGPGCLIGAADRSARAPLWFDPVSSGPTHSLIFAGPGGHKSLSSITRIWNWDGPRVVFDPSCEIGPIMTDALTRRGFNVTSIGLGSGGINALDWIEHTHPEAEAHIRSAVDWVYDEGAAMRGVAGQPKDPFWSTWGKALITCLTAHILFSERTDFPKTLATLRMFVATPESQMPQLLRGINASSNSRMARDIAGGLMGMRAEETFSSIYSNAFSATEWLSAGVYSDVVSGTAMHTADILKRKTVVFVQIPLRTLLSTPAVGRAIMGALFNRMLHADGTGVDDRILFQIDEAWTMGAMKEIKLCHTTARKYRGSVSSIWQSEGQLEGVWGRDDAKLMRDTVSWRSYNAIQDGDVAEKLSRDLGEHAVLAYSEGKNTGNQRQPMAWMGSKSHGDNVSTHEIKRRLIKADEIMRAPSDEMFVLARDFAQPIRCFTAPYFRYPDIAGRMAGNRFANAAAE